MLAQRANSLCEELYGEQSLGDGSHAVILPPVTAWAALMVSERVAPERSSSPIRFPPWKSVEDHGPGGNRRGAGARGPGIRDYVSPGCGSRAHP